MARSTPGYWTLTATARPSGITARCTWPMDAAATGTGSQSRKSLSGSAHRPRGGRARQRGHPGQDQRLAHRMPSFGSGPLAGRARLALGDSLVTEAEPGRGQGLEAVVVDRLTTGLALPVAPVVEPRECV